MTGAALPFTLRQLEYVVTVADTGTMSGAAELHHISQSAVSLAVSDLERALGIQMFLRRRSRGVALTDAAREVLPEIRNLLAHAGEIHSSARSLGRSLSGGLVVGCYPTLTPFLLPTILQRFGQQHPSVAIELFEGAVTDMLERLLDGTCEVALMYDLGIGPEIATSVLHRVRPYVLLPADHPLAVPGPVTLSELRDEPMIMLDMPPSVTLFREVLAAGGVEPRVRFTTSTFESVRSLVASGAGYSLLLQRPATDSTYAGPAVMHREIADDVRTIDVVVAHAHGARLTRRAHAFTEFCRTAFDRAPR